MHGYLRIKTHALLTIRSNTALGTRRKIFIQVLKLIDSIFLLALKLHTHMVDGDENSDEDD